MATRFLFLPISLGLLLPAAAIPWLTINFLGTHQYSAGNILTEFYTASSSPSSNRFDIVNLLSSYRSGFYSAVFSLTAYFVSLPAMVVSLAWRSHRPTIALIAGALAVVSAVTWIYSVESVKENFANQAAIFGGIIGEEFKGHENALADIIIRLGIGQYFVAAGGVVGCLFYLTEKKITRTRDEATTSI